MEYRIFKEEVEKKFKEFLPEKYQNFQVEIRSVEKTNHTLDGLLIKANAPGMHISPLIDVNQMYEDYIATGDLDATLARAAERFTKSMEQMNTIHVSEHVDPEYARDMVVFRLINTEQNKKMLANMPHREFNDLSVIYHMVAMIDGEEIASIPIHHEFADTLGFTEDQLFKLAYENTKRLFPPLIKPVNEIMRDVLVENGMPLEIAEMMLGEISPRLQMYVISNERSIHGTASLLYEDMLHELAEKLGSDLYILPASVHTGIAISTDIGDPNLLAEMVAEINMEQVAINERLSNQVYRYDKGLQMITLATDTPNKRLDGIVRQ